VLQKDGMIQIKQAQLGMMRKHAERDYPYECCGLLIGRALERGHKEVLVIHPISNAREEEHKRNRFLIRPEELLRGEQAASARNLDVIGFYHSHPDCAAIPSAYDREHAWPMYSYIVVSVLKGAALDLRSWELQGDRAQFNEEEILNGD
jgi:proteasome lid subunit RPN8/RPN11